MNAKPRDSGAMQLMARIRKAVDRGADVAESIHRKAAKLPLTAFEGVEPLEGALKDVQRMQQRAIGAIYDLVRDINHELVRLAEESFAEVEQQKKRRAPRKAARGRVRKAA